MIKYLLSIAVISLLWHMSLSTHECTRTINAGVLTFLCPSNVSSQLLNLYDLTVNQLDSVISIVAKGRNDTPTGPFTSIPPNICLLRNLQSIDFSSNQISDAEPTGALIKCSSKLTTLNLASNTIFQFPSALIYNIPSLTNLNFQRNQLNDVSPYSFADITSLDTIDFSYNRFTTFELWPTKVQRIADFSYNQISTIANNYFFTTFPYAFYGSTVYLTNNSATINLTDSIYAMFNQCQEPYQWVVSSDPDASYPAFTRALARIDFGTTRINCSCDQYYYLNTLINSYGNIQDTLEQPLPIKSAICSNGDPFLNSTCTRDKFNKNSTADFTQVYPKLCTINPNSTETLTPMVNFSTPTLNVSTYPHYETGFLNPGACFFTFTDTTTVNLRCTNDISNIGSTLPAALLSNTYMSTIKRVLYSSNISSLPRYLCSLPSGEIDLSYQAFTTLTDTTFPCLDSFSKITLSNNQLTSVSTTSQNFANLTYLDLSSNGLTSIPYSILRPTPTSLRVLDLRNNSIRSIDIFLYTLKNITVLLDNNPIDPSSIINPQNVTLDTNSTRSNDTIIVFPGAVTNSSYIVNDAKVSGALGCISILSLKNLFTYYKATFKTVSLECNCNSYSLKDFYGNYSANITSDLNCSNLSDTTTYLASTRTNCPNAFVFRISPCNETSATESTTSTEVILTSPNSTTAIAQGTTITPPAVEGSNRDGSGNRTGLIVGLVVGIVGALLVIGAILLALYLFKFKRVAPVKGKTEKRVDATSDEVIAKRVQPRNLRAVKLAPLATPASELPKVPVATAIPKSNSTLLANPNTNLRTAAKGIPVRLDPIRSGADATGQYPPNSNALNNSSSFRPIDNSTVNQTAGAEQPVKAPKPQKPPANSMLNIGGDKRH